MKKSRKLVLSVLLTVCAFCLCFALVGCSGGGDKDTAKYGYGEEGFYYYDGADSARYMLSLQSGTYMMTVNGAWAYSGSYSYDGESGKVSFKGDTDFAATMGESALSLNMEGSGYSFKAYKFFEVTYVDETGKTIAVESVLNGQSAEAPEIEKDGYWFIDWYIDSLGSAAYSFDTSIAGDTIIYGWYIEKNTEAVEHTVTLDYGDGVTEVWDTTNGAVYKTLPAENSDGEAIIGWWVSATNKSGELTYRYTLGDVIDADTTLFAVYSGIGSSVTSDGVTWDVASAGSNVSIEIKSSDGVTVISESSLSSTSGVYTSSAFSSLESGVYTVEVKSGSVTDTLVYVVNGLARVSLSSADIIENGSGRVLSFAPVEGADGYVITVTNGEKTVTEDLGNKTYYNFSSWEMTKEGITFVVTAYGEGYADSESDAYTYIKVLGDVTVAISDDVVSWNRVEGALEYAVTISDVDGNVVDFFYTSDTSFSLKYYENGTYDITVQPHTDGYYSEAKTYFGYAKDSLMAPKVTNVTNTGISWEDVGADYYVVMINGVSYGEDGTITGTTLYFSDTSLPESGDGKYEISVKAVKIGGSDSPYSDVVIATGEFSSTISYDKNTVYWNYDVEATSYGISVNGGTEMVVTEGNSAKVTLTKVGDNVITVTAYGDDGEALGSAETTVYAYSITLDPNGAELKNDTAVNGVIYVAQGDELDLGTAEKEHADFVGWYTLPDYTEGQSDEYEGKGSLVENGSTFTGNGSMYLYAYWSYEYIDVKLIVGMGSMTDGTGASVEEMVVRIKYNSTSYVLPVPAAYNPEDVFNGWYSGNYGAGTQYTTGSGTAVGAPFTGEDTTLYAYYLAVLYYSRTTYNGETVYAVSAGSSIHEVTDGVVTIPESYNGCRLILNSTAFENCSNLEVINLPDTVVYISVTNDGYRASTGAFAGCVALKEVNVYATELNSEPVYFSCDGVLFHKMDDEGDGAEIIYYPYGKEQGAYSIPSQVYNEFEYTSSGISHDVTSIPSMVFRDRKITEVTIPSTVTHISNQAFYSNNYLTKVVFEDGAGDALVLEDNAFRDCRAIAEVTLPSRYTEFNAGAFSDCIYLENVYISGSSVYSSYGGILLSADGTKLEYYPIGRSGDVDTSALSSSVITEIGSYGFAYNTRITSVTISSAVTLIDESAFEGCMGITSVAFEGGDNSSDLTIKTRAFYGCTLIREISLPSNLTALEKDAFAGCTNLLSVYYNARPSATKESLSGLEAGAFGTNNYITSLTLGVYVPDIDFVSIFDGGRLAEVVIEETVVDGQTVVNQYYFSDGYGVVYDKDASKIIYYPLGRVGAYELLASTQSIDEGVFEGRVGLTSITIGDGVNTIAEGAFDGCTSLEKIIVSENNENYGSDENGILYKKTQNASGGYELTKLLLCPAACTSTSVTVGSAVTSMAEGAFKGNTKITSVTIEATDSFTLGEDAFNGCTALTSVSLPDCMTVIPKNAFYGCSALTSVNIPASAVTIDEYAFYHCYSLTGDLNRSGEDDTSGIELPEGLVTIGDHAFDIYDSGTAYTYQLAVTIPASVRAIGDYAFYGCWNATSSKVGIVFASVEEEGDTQKIREDGSGESGSLTIGQYAFAYTRYATSVTIPAGTTSIGVRAFQYFGYQLGTSDPVPTFSFEDGCEIATISDYMLYYSKITEITIPDSVTAINQYAFNYCTALAAVNFGENSKLETIGASAFNRAILDKVVIPASVTEIGSSAFAGASATSLCLRGDNLEDDETPLTFAEGSRLETIGSTAFQYTGITELEIPASVTSVGQSAFASSTSLTKVTFLAQENLGDTETVIGYSCFKGCSALSDVTLPANLKETGNNNTGDGMFATCTSLVEITIPKSVETIDIKTFTGCSSLTTVNFKTDDETQLCSLKEIKDNAFLGCTSLESFVFPESTAESITLGATIFSGCTKMSSLTLSSGVTSIGSAFQGLTLTSLTVSDGNTHYKTDKDGNPIMYSIDKGAGEKAVTYVFGTLTGDITIPSGVKSIDGYAYSGQTQITSLAVPADVVSIGDYAFSDCTSLKSVVFEGDWTAAEGSLGTHLFDGCTALTSVTLPVGITSLPDYIFQSCPLTEFTLPETVTAIGAYAFEKTRMTELDLTYVATVGNRAFESMTSLTTVTFGRGITSLGEYAFHLCSALTAIDLPTSLSRIEQYTFNGCSSLTKVEIPGSITYIGSDAFQDCTSLVEFVFPDSVTEVGDCLFKYDTKLTTVNIPKGMTEIPLQMFYGCAALVSIVIPDNIVSIGQSAFNSCSSLSSIELSQNLVSIGNQSFASCTALRDIILPSSVTTLDTSAFAKSGLETITLNEGLTSIGQQAFSQCSSLKSVVIPRTVTTMGTQVFYLATALTYIYTGDSMTSVVDDMFNSCTSLATVELGAAVKSIGASAFSGCTALTTIALPNGLDSIGSSAFSGCSNLEYLWIPATVTSIASSAFAQCAACSLYVQNSVNYADAYWSGWNTDFTGTAYFYSQTEPAGFNDSGTDYDGNYWHYDENGEIAVWTFTYTTYTVEAGGYVLCSESGGTISYVCMSVGDGEDFEVFAVNGCTSGTVDGTYSVELSNGESYTVTLTDTEGTLTATVTAVAD